MAYPTDPNTLYKWGKASKKPRTPVTMKAIKGGKRIPVYGSASAFPDPPGLRAFRHTMSQAPQMPNAGRLVSGGLGAIRAVGPAIEGAVGAAGKPVTEPNAMLAGMAMRQSQPPVLSEEDLPLVQQQRNLDPSTAQEVPFTHEDLRNKWGEQADWTPEQWQNWVRSGQEPGPQSSTVQSAYSTQVTPTGGMTPSAFPSRIERRPPINALQAAGIRRPATREYGSVAPANVQGGIQSGFHRTGGVDYFGPQMAMGGGGPVRIGVTPVVGGEGPGRTIDRYGEVLPEGYTASIGERRAGRSAFKNYMENRAVERPELAENIAANSSAFNRMREVNRGGSPTLGDDEIAANVLANAQQRARTGMGPRAFATMQRRQEQMQQMQQQAFGMRDPRAFAQMQTAQAELEAGRGLREAEAERARQQGKLFGAEAEFYGKTNPQLETELADINAALQGGQLTWEQANVAKQQARSKYGGNAATENINPMDVVSRDPTTGQVDNAAVDRVVRMAPEGVDIVEYAQQRGVSPERLEQYLNKSHPNDLGRGWDRFLTEFSFPSQVETHRGQFRKKYGRWNRLIEGLQERGRAQGRKPTSMSTNLLAWKRP